MADKRTDRSRSNGQERRASATGEQLTAADDVGAAAKSATATAQRKAKKRIQKLTRELDRARATADKRMRQVELAREKLEKRERDAAAAATEVTSIMGRIRDEAGPGATDPDGSPAAETDSTTSAPKAAPATKSAAAVKAAPPAKASTPPKAAAAPVRSTASVTASTAAAPSRATDRMPASSPQPSVTPATSGVPTPSPASAPDPGVRPVSPPPPPDPAPMAEAPAETSTAGSDATDTPTGSSPSSDGATPSNEGSTRPVEQARTGRVTDRPSVGAAVDLGSNSVHLLVAAIHGHQLRPLADESVFLGLGTTIDAASAPWRSSARDAGAGAASVRRPGAGARGGADHPARDRADPSGGRCGPDRRRGRGRDRYPA